MSFVRPADVRIYPTAPGGREWALADNQSASAINNDAVFVPETSTITVVQAGTPSVYHTEGNTSDKEVRLSVHSPAGARWWRNVEMTGYFRHAAVVVGGTYAPHVELHARGERHTTTSRTKSSTNAPGPYGSSNGIAPPAGTEGDLWPWWGSFAPGDSILGPAFGTAYHGNLYQEGAGHTDYTVAVEKELSHTEGYCGQRALAKPTNAPIVGQWYGFKIAIRNSTALDRVLIETWYDERADGNWVKLTEYVDEAGASPAHDWTPEAAVNLHNLQGTGTGTRYGIRDNEIITWAGPWVTFRSDAVSLDFSGFSVREIAPYAAPTVPPPRYVAAGAKAETTSAATVTPGLPAGRVMGQVLVAYVYSRTAGVHALPSPWARKIPATGIATNLSSWWRRVDGTEVAPVVTFNGGKAAGVAGAVVLSYDRCASSGDPFDAGSATAFSLSMQHQVKSAPLVLANGNCLVLHLGGWGYGYNGWAEYQGVFGPAPTIPNDNPRFATNPGSSSRQAFVVYDGVHSSSGSTGAPSGFSAEANNGSTLGYPSATYPFQSAQLALRPDSAAPALAGNGSHVAGVGRLSGSAGHVQLSGAGATVAAAGAVSGATGYVAFVGDVAGEGSGVAGVAAVSGAAGAIGLEGDGTGTLGAGALAGALGHVRLLGDGAGLAGVAGVGQAEGAVGYVTDTGDAAGEGTGLAGGLEMSGAAGFVRLTGDGAGVAGAGTVAGAHGAAELGGDGTGLTGVGHVTVPHFPISETLSVELSTQTFAIVIARETVTLDIAEDVVQPPFLKVVPEGDGEEDLFTLTLDGVAQPLAGKTVTLTVQRPDGELSANCPLEPDEMKARIPWRGELTRVPSAPGGGFLCSIRVAGAGDDPHTRFGTLKVPKWLE